MRVETPAELDGFFSPDEFGELATLRTKLGTFDLPGHPDAFAASAKPGGTQNSSRSPFTTGAAEFSVTELQFMCAASKVAGAGAVAEDTLTITTGDYSGDYRIKNINRDGAICRLLLSKR